MSKLKVTAGGIKWVVRSNGAYRGRENSTVGPSIANPVTKREHA